MAAPYRNDHFEEPMNTNYFQGFRSSKRREDSCCVLVHQNPFRQPPAIKVRVTVLKFLVQLFLTFSTCHVTAQLQTNYYRINNVGTVDAYCNVEIMDDP